MIKQLVKKILPERVTGFISSKMPHTIPMNMTDEEREKFTDKVFYSVRGRHLDFNDPKLFTEKIQWYKLYYGHPDLSRIVCKYNFKKYVAEKLGSEEYTIPLYGAWVKVEDIDWNRLPETFVLKSNSSSAGNYIKIIKKKSETDIEKLKEELKEWLKPENTLVYSLGRAYFDVTPMILAEKYMEEIDGQLYDYKFFCFNGEPTCLFAAINRFHEDNFPMVYYDMDWNRLDVRFENHTVCDVEKPVHFDEMVDLAKKLSKDFPFVRVDFFDTPAHVYLAEMTFYPGSFISTYTPESFDAELGAQFVLPEKSFLGRKFRPDLGQKET